MAKQLKIVVLLNPGMCKACRFSSLADVKLPNGTTERMIHCNRADCDNWEWRSMSGAESFADVPKS